MRGVALCLLVPLGTVEDFRLGALLEHPVQSAAWFGAISCSLILAMMVSSSGGKRCPVAVSSVVYTAVNMATGYLVLSLLFGAPPHLLTVIGALCMVAAVIATAVANRKGRAKQSSTKDVNATSGADVKQACNCSISGCCPGKQHPIDG